ncbi:MAG: hypothetical protein ED859_15805 [Desulfuromonadales bacterium]|nr:MAG: hypothetical protein ED859_15805 [Desulfuromonadales bacterium]
MSLIAGAVDFSKHDEEMIARINKMLGFMMHENYYIADNKVAGSCGIGSLAFGRSVSLSKVIENDHFIFAFSGKVYEIEKLAKKVSMDAVEGTDLLSILLEICERTGPEGLAGMNGIYLAAVWEKKAKTLHIVNDRYGFKKLYYWHEGNKFVFSSEYKAISFLPEFSRKIDEYAFINLMTFGYVLEDRTLFEQIKVLPPASVVTFREGKMTVRKYWNYSFHENGDSRLSEDEYVDAFVDKITSAVKKNVKGVERLALPISGGLDSRTIAAVLKKINTVPYIKAYSHGNTKCFDVRYGKEIAKTLGFPHATDVISADFVKSNATAFQYIVEGMVACDWAWEIDLQKNAFHKDNIDCVISGFFGDVLCGSDMTWNRLHDVSDDETAILKIYKRHVDSFNDYDAAIYFNRKVYNRVKDYNYETFRKTYYDAPTTNIYNRARYVNLLQFQRRFGSTMLDRYEIFTEVLSPFTDYEFVDFILHVPVDLQLRQSLYKSMLIRHFPEVAKVGYTGTGMPINPSKLQAALRWRAEKYANLLKTISLGAYGKHDYSDYRNTAEALRTKSRSFMLKAFANNKLKNAFFDANKFDELTDEFLSSKSTLYEKVCYPLTFFVWASIFLPDDYAHSREEE